ncbi:MAG: FtsX-like permease family protein [Kiritimatiellae bacterium]|nr:FtsX-like permease family protein [Kiritimatiellia bacterium]
MGLTTRTLARRSLRFYWRTNVSVLLGVIVAGATLSGALLVGDSVRFSLRRFALLRLGRTEAAMRTRHRYFSDDLAVALEEKLGGGEVAAVLNLEGMAIGQDASGANRRQVNRIQVLGVDARFWAVAGGPGLSVAADEAVLNAKLAAELGVRVGDEVSIRVAKPSLMPRDAPLSSRKESLTERGTLTVKRVIADTEGGRFSLEANQIAPYNAFVDRAWLQSRIDLPARANLLIVAGRGAGGAVAEEADRALKDVWRLEHAGMTLREFRQCGLWQLESDRVFLDPVAARAALAATERSVGALTYLVNSLSCGSGTQRRSTPYSFVTAVAPSSDPGLSVVPAGMRDDQILINRWLADHLAAGPGDRVDVAYFEISPSGTFIEKTRSFSVLGVVEMDALAAERALVPDFPGLTDVDRCSDWDIGMPMDEERLKDKPNEAYWNTYRATPKAFLTLAAGRAIWANRFGDLSAARYPLDPAKRATLQAAIRDRIDPQSLGFVFLPVREQAMKAVSEAIDFGQLFIGMSFFLIAAALMLTGLLFVFGIQHRAEEMGTLLALGFRTGQIRRLFLWEGGALAAIGALTGAALGTVYTRALMWGLGTYWQGAVAGSALQYHAEPATLVTGIAASSVCALAAMLLAMWRQSRRSARELLQADWSAISAVYLGQSRAAVLGRPGPGEDARSTPLARRRCSGRRVPWGWLLPSTGVLVAGLGIVAVVVTGVESTAMAFFGAGALLLVSGMGFIGHGLGRLGRATAASGGRPSLNALGIRNAARRRGRSLTAAGLLACGCFMVFAVSSMQEDLRAHARERWSGTGGFELFGQSTIPVPGALEGDAAREEFQLADDAQLAGIGVTSIKVHDGDDASCFNLNRAQTPRLLGVDPEAFGRRGAFMPEGMDARFWQLLYMPLPDGLVPGFAGDMDTAMWGLHKKVGPEKGETLFYRDERGDVFNVKLVGALPMRLSVFQGSVLIAKAHFNGRYPSEDGYRMFLFDGISGDVGAVRRRLTVKLERVGLDVTTTVDRMLEFYSVVTTYLAMFLVLGGLGLLLGSIGLGIIVLRNVLERRGELALLKCVGFSQGQVAHVVVAEHALLLLAGLFVGVGSAAVALWPSLRSPSVHVPYATIGLLLGGVLVGGLLWIVAAARLALRRPLVAALRSE